MLDVVGDGGVDVKNGCILDGVGCFVSENVCELYVLYCVLVDHVSDLPRENQERVFDFHDWGGVCQSQSELEDGELISSALGKWPVFMLTGDFNMTLKDMNERKITELENF